MKSSLFQSSKSQFFFHFTSPTNKLIPFNHLCHKKCLTIPKSPNFSSLRASCIANPTITTLCNGWDDPISRTESGELISESNQLRKLLILLGIDDKKYAFIYVIGFVSALAISRIKMSSIIIFPASALIFVIGFSFGFVNGKPQTGARNTKIMDDGFRVYNENLKKLMGLFDEFDGKVSGLKSDLKRAIDYKRVGINDLEGFVDSVESMGECVMNAKTFVENQVNNVLIEEAETVSSSDMKSSKKKKKDGKGNGFDLFGIVQSFFIGNVPGMQHNRGKDSTKKEHLKNDVKDAEREVSLGYIVENGVSGPKTARNATMWDLGDAASFESFDKNGNETLGSRAKEMSKILEHRKRSSMDMDYGNRRFDQDFHYKSSIHSFTSNETVNLDISELDGIRASSTREGLHSRVRTGHTESTASHRHEQMYHDSYGVHPSSFSRVMAEDETYSDGFGVGKFEEDNIRLREYQQLEEELSSSPAISSAVSEDVLFDKYLTTASSLLRQAKDSLRITKDEKQAEKMLNESTILFNKAIDMKPVSLLAIGQLGNTYLLHGELKLRISRELRTLLSRSSNLSTRAQNNILNLLYEPAPSRDQIASLLIVVCEECEELFVEAGRKYRMALSIDGNDSRALYNWGLALTFRAQLIAGIGPEAARDADKLFMAAIDKFDAMMARSNVYAPDALFRWGMALQQRSRLRPNKSREKVKLLQQAKRLYEDALDMGSDNLRVKEALSTCISELDLWLV